MRASTLEKKTHTDRQFFVKKGERCYTYPWPHHHHLLLFTTLCHYSEKLLQQFCRASVGLESERISIFFSSWIENTRYSLNFSA